MEAATQAPASLDRVVQARQAIKDARTVKRHAWEKEDLVLEESQKKLDQFILSILNANGASSIATEHGTAIRSLKLKPSAADWNAIWEWMKANDAAELLERRLKTTFIKEYMEEHDGAIPPGINVLREYEVTVRRPRDPAPGGSPAGQGEE
jgi:hypothetical protein